MASFRSGRRSSAPTITKREEHSPTRSDVDEMPVGALSSASREIYKGVHEFNMEHRGRDSIRKSGSSGQSPLGTQVSMFRSASPEPSPSPPREVMGRRLSLCPSIDYAVPRMPSRTSRKSTVSGSFHGFGDFVRLRDNASGQGRIDEGEVKDGRIADILWQCVPWAACAMLLFGVIGVWHAYRTCVWLCIAACAVLLAGSVDAGNSSTSSSLMILWQKTALIVLCHLFTLYLPLTDASADVLDLLWCASTPIIVGVVGVGSAQSVAESLQVRTLMFLVLSSLGTIAALCVNKNFKAMLSPVAFLIDCLLCPVAISTAFKKAQEDCEERAQRIQQSQSELLAKSESTRMLICSQVPEVRAKQLLSSPPSTWHRAPHDTFTNVTIIQMDISGFTVLSSKLSAVELLDFVNSIFTSIDSAAECVGQVWKVETIGDCYKAVVGGPNPCDDPTYRGAVLAYTILEIVTKISEMCEVPLQVRMGLHVGDVTAAMVGVELPRYMIYGKDAEICNQLEAQAELGTGCAAQRWRRDAWGWLWLAVARAFPQHTPVALSQAATDALGPSWRHQALTKSIMMVPAFKKVDLGNGTEIEIFKSLPQVTHMQMNKARRRFRQLRQLHDALVRCNLSVLVARERSSASHTYMRTESTESYEEASEFKGSLERSRPEAVDIGIGGADWHVPLQHDVPSPMTLQLPATSVHERPAEPVIQRPAETIERLASYAGPPTTFEAGIEALATLHLKWRQAHRVASAGSWDDTANASEVSSETEDMPPQLSVFDAAIAKVNDGFRRCTSVVSTASWSSADGEPMASRRRRGSGLSSEVQRKMRQKNLESTWFARRAKRGDMERAAQEEERQQGTSQESMLRRVASTGGHDLRGQEQAPQVAMLRRTQSHVSGSGAQSVLRRRSNTSSFGRTGSATGILRAGSGGSAKRAGSGGGRFSRADSGQSSGSNGISRTWSSGTYRSSPGSQGAPSIRSSSLEDVLEPSEAALEQLEGTCEENAEYWEKDGEGSGEGGRCRSCPRGSAFRATTATTASFLRSGSSGRRATEMRLRRQAGTVRRGRRGRS